MQSRASNEELALCRRLLRTGERCDGREPLEGRALALRPADDGAVEVSLGGTHLFVSAASAVVAPPPGRRNEGILRLRLDFGLPAHVLVNGRRARETADEVVRALEKVIKGSKAFDTEALVLKAGKFVWELSVDITVIANDGNLLDAANFGVLAALIAHKHKIVEVDGERLRFLDRPPRRFALNHIPLILSFGVAGRCEAETPENAEFAVYDPTVNLSVARRERLRGETFYSNELL